MLAIFSQQGEANQETPLYTHDHSIIRKESKCWHRGGEIAALRGERETVQLLENGVAVPQKLKRSITM